MLSSLNRTSLVLALLIAPSVAVAQSTGMGEKMADKMADKMDTKMDAMGMAMVAGDFKGAGDHPASGHYTISAEKGKMMLKTSADFARDAKAPDVHLVLARGTSVGAGNGMWLGKVSKATGAQSFTIPANAKLDGYDTVVLWCKKFNALMGSAPLNADALSKVRSEMMGDKMGGKMGDKMSKPPAAR